MHLEKDALAVGSSDMNYKLSLAIVAIACPRLLDDRVCWQYRLCQLESDPSVGYFKNDEQHSQLAKSSVRQSEIEVLKRSITST